MYADAIVWLYIQSACREVARDETTTPEFRPPVSVKIAEEKMDASLLSSVLSEPPLLGSRQLFLARSDARFGPKAGVASCPGFAAVSASDMIRMGRNP